jgi:hypothetical protein
MSSARLEGAAEASEVAAARVERRARVGIMIAEELGGVVRVVGEAEG